MLKNLIQRIIKKQKQMTVFDNFRLPFGLYPCNSCIRPLFVLTFVTFACIFVRF